MKPELLKKLKLGLLFLRLSIFLVMFMWTIDKIMRMSHAAGVFKNFYNIELSNGTLMMVLGFLELLLLACFIAGFKKRISYGLVLMFHFISTISSFKQYLNPFEGPGLLFFAAWPMLAACWMLYALREEDTLLALK
jgi:hypothetical protein